MRSNVNVDWSQVSCGFGAAEVQVKLPSVALERLIFWFVRAVSAPDRWWPLLHLCERVGSAELLGFVTLMSSGSIVVVPWLKVAFQWQPQ